NILFAGRENLLQRLAGVMVASLNTFEVDHTQAAEAAHFDAERNVRDPVHGTGHDGNLQGNSAAIRARDLETRINLEGVDGHVSRNEGDLIKSVGDTSFSVAANPHSHR